jgi:UDP-arabinose 4-epimerase
MRILVTGGAGYIGSHTSKLLARAGYVPIVYDNLSRGHRAAAKWGPLLVGDVGDRAQLLAALRYHKIEAVLHFAALAYVGESMRDPGLYFRNNVTSTLVLLEAMREANVPWLVFSSSCATYGELKYTPTDESHSQIPLSPYGQTKLFAEQAIQWYESLCGLRCVCLRYFNAAGADPDGEIGEDHDPETHLVPMTIDAALGERPALDVYGSDYPTPDGTAVRDYVHVTDLGAAHLQALEYLFEGGQGHLAVNLGAGRGYSVREVIDAVGKISGRTVPFRLVARRPGDPPSMIADTKRAKDVLRWTPEYSDIEMIVSTALLWRLKRAEKRIER